MPAMVDENREPNAAPVADMFFVPQKAFKSLKTKIAKKGTISDKDVDALVNWTPVKTDMYVPIDMNGAGENLDDFEAALAKFGAQKTAECFVRAFEFYEKSKKSMSPSDCIKVLSAKEWKDKYGEDDDDDDEEEEDTIKALMKYTPDLFYVPQKAYEALKSKLSKAESISNADVDALVNWEPCSGETYLPLDMNGADEDLDEFEEALQKLGAKRTAECFVQAMASFEKNKHKLPAEKQTPLTAKQWKDVHQEDGEEEEGEDGEDEDEDDDDDDDEDGEDGEDDEEPPSKKQKKDLL